jgi:hypothetical protein
VADDEETETEDTEGAEGADDQLDGDYGGADEEDNSKTH